MKIIDMLLHHHAKYLLNLIIIHNPLSNLENDDINQLKRNPFQNWSLKLLKILTFQSLALKYAFALKFR